MDPSYLRNSTRMAAVSLIVAVLLALASLGSLIFPAVFYSTEELRRTFLANDIVNLLIGLPILLLAMIFAQRGSLVGLFFWPGALFYVTYNSIAYVFAMPLTLAFTLNLLLVLLSVYGIYGLLSGLEGETVRERLTGRVSERFTGGALVVLGLLFFLMAVIGVFNYAAGQSDLSWAQVSVQIADLLVTPAWVLGGILLWRRQVLGYASGVGLLFQACMLFVGLLVYFLLLPYVTGEPFPAGDFIVIAIMSLVCFIPLGLFLRGSMRKSSQD